MGLTIRKSARKTVREVVGQFWSKTAIPLKQEIKGVEMIENIHTEWRSLNKSKNRNQAEKVQNFQEKLGKLFDMSVKNASLSMENASAQEKNPTKKAAIQEDLQFLKDQQNLQKRQGSIGRVDRKLATEEKKKQDRLKRKEERERILNERRKKSSGSVGTGENVSLENPPSPEGSANDDDYEPTANEKRKTKARKLDVFSPDLVQAMDASKISVNQATVVLAATAQSLGVNVNDTNINRATVHKKRTKIRGQIATKIREEFSQEPDEVLTLHWDGKIVPKLVGREDVGKVDRQAVVVTGATTCQLLGAPALQHGTGRAIAESVVSLVKRWNVVENLGAMCFVTPSTNTGPYKGAAVLIQILLDKDLLWLACRHHVLEITLAGVYFCIMGPSHGPEIKIFGDFRNQWEKVDQDKIETPKEYPAILDPSRREALISFAKQQIEVGQPRDDYLELLQLSIVFLGGELIGKLHPPGAIHLARWMSKAIYSLTMSLFAEQTGLTQVEKEGLLVVCHFIVSTYIEAWFSAPFPASAPRTDLQLVANIDKFSSVHPAAASVAATKICSHLWYLSEENIGLAVFDEGIPEIERERLVSAIQTKQGEEDPLKRLVKPFAELKKVTIPDLGTVNTAKFFKILKIDMDFFECPADSWNSNDSYKRGKKIVDSLSVVIMLIKV